MGVAAVVAPAMVKGGGGGKQSSVVAELQIVNALLDIIETWRRTVILSIHQPRARIVKMFVSFLLVATSSIIQHDTIDLICSVLVDGLMRVSTCSQTSTPSSSPLTQLLEDREERGSGRGERWGFFFACFTQPHPRRHLEVL